jgi:F0F1-type ATP synthase membrane subunit b/b'
MVSERLRRRRESLLSLALFPLLVALRPPALVLFIPVWIPKTINLLIFLGILYFLLRRPTREFFRQRFAQIRASLERAAKEKEAAAAKLAEIDARLNRLDAELTEIRAQAEREAAAERERIEVTEREDVEKLRAMTQREIEAAKKAAIIELRQFAAEKSVELAEQIIRRELTPEDDARLFRRLSEEMQRAK